jgi:hypothetical protein
MAQMINPTRYVSIDQLKFDQNNPRLPTTVDASDDNAVLEYMLDDGNIIELMGSIGVQGYSENEPLIVVADSDGMFTVVEGNRRLTALKLLRNPDLAPTNRNQVQAASDEATEKPEAVPVLVYPDRKDVLEYLGFRHITGVKPWGSLEKAKYLYQLKGTLGNLPTDQLYRRLAKIIGSRSDYVERLLSGYSVYDTIVQEHFFGIKNLKEDDVDFSVLTTALSYTNIAEYVGLQEQEDGIYAVSDKGRLGDITSWMFERNQQQQTRVGESRNLKLLSDVVSSPKALDAFKNAGRPLQEAVKLTQAPTESFRLAIREALSRLEDARGLVHLVEEPKQTDADLLFEIQKLARSLKAVVDEGLVERSA